MFRHLIAAAAMLALAGCGNETAAPAPTVFETDNPQHVRDWGQVYARDGRLEIGAGVTPYDLVTPLFSDYAHKLRTVWMPPGVSAAYDATGTFHFPVGTVITKTFFYPQAQSGVAGEVAQTYDTSRDFIGDSEGEGLDLHNVRLVETRVLVRREGGWATLPYVWNADQTEATLKRTGATERLTLVDDNGAKTPFVYMVPDANQCAGCHATNNTTRTIEPIGPKARHLNKDYVYTDGVENQLVYWTEAGILTGAPEAEAAPRDASWSDKTAPLTARARAYLDINCAHCHNPVGPADVSGLFLGPETPFGPSFGVCKQPVAAGGGTGGRLYDIDPGDPDRSVLLYRLASTNPGDMMPEVGRAVTHTEGVALLTEWIASMQGECEGAE